MENMKIQFTDKDITPWGGMSLMQNMMEQIGFREKLKTIDLPEQGSNRGYKPYIIIEAFIASVWCGANRFLHTEVLRQDNVLTKIFNWERFPGQDSFKRYFKKFNQTINNRIFNELNRWFFNELKFDNYTLDFDSTILTRYGNQQGAAKGYNPHKPGRKSHHPLMAFIDDIKMVANFWLRAGNTGASTNFLNFLEDTLSKLSGKKVGLLRADSGFFGEEILEYLETKQINYIIAAKFYPTIKRAIAEARTWLSLSDGIAIAETKFKCKEWEKERRIIIIRQRTDKRPEASGKQITLFGEEIDHSMYRYSCYVTNLDLPAAVVWRNYRGRANAENRIKELKYDFGLDSFNMNNFYATEAALSFAMIAYNLMSLFRQFVMKSDVQNRMSTLRLKTFAIGAYLVKDGRNLVLTLALKLKRREWFTGLWNDSKLFTLPVYISNA